MADLILMDPAKMTRKWVAYFDILGFSDCVRKAGIVEGFCRWEYCLAKLKENAWSGVDFVWFSDTFIYYTADDLRPSYRAIDHSSRWFFEDVVERGVLLRGALACGEFYACEADRVYIGKALIDAHETGEKYNWVGFVLHESALQRMKEVSQPLGSSYRKGEAEFRIRGELGVNREGVTAFCMANCKLEESARSAGLSESHEEWRKIANAIEFQREPTQKGD